MSKKGYVGFGSLLVVAAVWLVSCGNRSTSHLGNEDRKTDLKLAIVTDIGGIDDKSFNQSAWEGLQEWGKENSLSKSDGYDYFQSTHESDYINNLEQAVSNGYQLVYGIGFALRDTVAKVADNHLDVNYVIIDSVIEHKKNVASVTFKDNEAAYLAGVAAAKNTKTNHVGFIGGMESEVIARFEKGFEAGVKSVDPSIQVDISYAGSFSDAAKGKMIASAQYSSGADIIFHASGGTGAGIFSEARSVNETRNENKKVWVIGVDRDQSNEGVYVSKDGKKSNFVLTSTLKEVGATVKDIAAKTMDGQFPGGENIVYGLKDGGVDLVMSNFSGDVRSTLEEVKARILEGSIRVPAS